MERQELLPRALGERSQGKTPQGKTSQGKTMTRQVAIALLLLIGTIKAATGQDLAAGENSFRKCLPCHAVGEGAKNKVGPVLNGLAGRKTGTIDGYSYSSANKNSGIVWDTETFKDYIRDPRSRIPGTKMVFTGIKGEQEIADLWAFLEQFDPTGKKKN
jgi:cytochrome c